jgi:hypothetical protein
MMTMELERLLITECCRVARGMGITVVSYNQDGFILQKHPRARECLASLNRDLATYFHELRVKSFTYDPSLFAPEGATPTDEQLLELFRGVDLVSYDQNCIVPRDLYWHRRMRFLANHFYCPSQAMWYWVDPVSGEYGGQYTSAASEANSSVYNVQGVCLKRKGVRQLDLVKHLTIEDRLRHMTHDFANVVYKAGVPIGITRDPLDGVSLNIWRPVRAHNLPKARCDRAVEVFLQLANVVCGEVEVQTTHLLKTIAHVLQRPKQRVNIAFCVVGKQGCGKSLLFEQLGLHVFGDKRHYTSISNVEAEMFGNFNERIERRSLILVNEVRSTLKEKYQSALKDLITSPMHTINPKGRPPFSAENNPLIIITSNKAEPVTIEAGDRRYFLVNCTERLRGNSEFFSEFVALMSSNEGARAVYDHLMSIDLTDFLPSRIPETALKMALQPTASNPILEFLIDLAANPEEPKDIPATVLWEKYKVWACESEVATLDGASLTDTTGPENFRDFGIMTSQMTDLLAKRRTASGMMCKLLPKLLEMAKDSTGATPDHAPTPAPSPFPYISPPVAPPVATPVATPVAPPLAPPVATPPPAIPFAIPTATAPAIPLATPLPPAPTPTFEQVRERMFEFQIVAAPPPPRPTRGIVLDFTGCTTTVVEPKPKFDFSRP